MKRALLLIITFALTNIVIGQTFVITNNPTFDSVQVVPNNPTNNDSINFIIYISNEIPGTVFFTAYDSLGNRIPNIKISNDSIYIYENSMGPFWDTTDIFIDTISFGVFNPGQYHVLLINKLFWLYEPTHPTSYIDTAGFILPISLSILDEQVNDNFITLYPNPTTGKIKINTENIENVFVINEIGITVLNLEKTNEIDLTNFPKGIYFIKVHTDKFVQVKKIIIH